MSDVSALEPWNCPGCGRKYRIAAVQSAPALCPSCGTATAGIPAASPPFEELIAAVAAADEPAQSRSADSRPQAATVLELTRPDIARRRRTRGEWRVLGVMASAILVIAGWGVFRLWGTDGHGLPNQAQIWKQAKAEVADRLRAPKTADFPKPGEIKRLRERRLPTWTVRSVVDAQNEYGVPVRQRWMVQLVFDPRAHHWETEFIEIDDDRVFETEAAAREDREFVASRSSSRAAEEKKRAPRSPRLATKTRQSVPAAGESTDASAGPAGPPPEITAARRERGQWREVARFTGPGPTDTKAFRVSAGGWRYVWECAGPATIRVFDAARRPVGHEIELEGAESGSQTVREGPGAFSFSITTDSKWSLIVEE